MNKWIVFVVTVLVTSSVAWFALAETRQSCLQNCSDRRSSCLRSKGTDNEKNQEIQKECKSEYDKCEAGCPKDDNDRSPQ